jgi:hypothetical protein
MYDLFGVGAKAKCSGSKGVLLGKVKVPKSDK